MRFLVISDIHGNLEALDKLDEEFKKSDAVLFAGDFAEFGNIPSGKPVLDKLCNKHDTIFAVTGNCDEPSFVEDIEEKDISVQKTLAMYEGLAIAGSGGGSKFTGTTPNERSDEELAGDLNIVTENYDGEWNNLIAIMHNPPKDTKCDMIESGVHVGSQSLRDFIEKTKPLAVITGHIHESAAVDKIGNTTVINPGALLENHYAIMEVKKEEQGWNVTETILKTL